jgi:predicted metal-dependent peptidase
MSAMKEWLQSFVSQPDFVRSYRYYAAILSRLDPINDATVPVMGVSAHGRRFYLHVNVDYFLQPPTNLQYLKGVLLHEVHHIILGHLSHRKFREAAHPQLMELAMEMSANEFIKEPLPGHPPRWQDYNQFGISTSQSTMERYEILVQAMRDGKIIVCKIPVDSHLARGVGHIFPGGREPDLGSPVRVRELIREAIALGPKGGGLLAGRDPANFLEELPDTDREPEQCMDWKTAIRMFLAQARTPLHTFARPNRRFRDLVGVVPGRLWSPRPVHPPRLLVAIDTSASMSTAELVEIARQLIALRDYARFTVIECDVVIQRVYEFAGRIENVAGRGGTDLRPVFRPEFLEEHRADGVIYFTDGEGPYPDADPGVKTLWVLSKPWEFGCPWGKKAHLPRFAPVDA